jgi:hypothetical protein
MQNDVANNEPARLALLRMLRADQGVNKLTESESKALTTLLETKGLKREKLITALPGIDGKIDTALAANPAEVNAQDDASLDEVVTKVNTAFGAAAHNPNGPGGLDPDHPDWNLVARVGGWANGVPDINDTNRFLRAAPEVTSGGYGGFLRQQDEFQKRPFDRWAGRIESATETGQTALDALPHIMPAEPVNLFNSDSFRDEVAGRNLLNSDTLPQNLLNTTERDLRNAEEDLHKAGY